MVFKGCERCGGDLFVEEFLGTRDLVCLQCGHRQASQDIGAARGQSRDEEETVMRWLQSARPSRAA